MVQVKRPKTEPRWNTDGIVELLARETQHFKELCQANVSKTSDRQKQIQSLRRGIAERQVLLKRLAMRAEDCSGAYQTVVEAVRAIALAEWERRRSSG